MGEVAKTSRNRHPIVTGRAGFNCCMIALKTRHMAENDGKSGCFVGVDFGGTKIFAGVFNDSLRLLGTAKVSTKAQRGPDAVIERVARCVRDAVDEADLSLQDVRGVGVGAPGAVAGDTGNVIFAPNLDWRDVPLKTQLEKLLGMPVFVENDGNLLGEKPTPRRGGSTGGLAGPRLAKAAPP